MLSEDLSELLRVARENNARSRITGVLLYQDGMFLQALEGSEPDVRSLFEKIARDPRHGRAEVVWSGNVAARSFGDWSMGFASADDPEVARLDGYRDFFGKQSFALWVNPSRATDLLREFRGLPWRLAMGAARSGKT